jgi:hypothetical protein
MLLMCKLKGAALIPFLSTEAYDSPGFEMVAKLQETYAPLKDINIYANIMSLMYLEQASDSVDKFTSKICRLHASLKSGGISIDPRIISALFMRGLGNQFDLLKQDFMLNSSKYVIMPLGHLEQTRTHFSSSMKLIKDEDIHNTGNPRLASAADGPSSALTDWKQVVNKKKGK